MGVWDAISSGRLPSTEDLGETYNGAASAVSDAGAAVSSTVSDGAGYLADGAVAFGQTAAGYGQRAVDGAADLGRQGVQLVEDGADAAYHGLTDWHFEGRDALNGPAPGQGDLTDPSGGWVRQPPWMADLHQDPDHAGREVKYVNGDGRESIRYDDGGADGGEVTDGRYKGTYNYVNPGNWDQLQNQGTVMGVPVGGALEWAGRGIGHAALDIAPWLLGGNVRGPG